MGISYIFATVGAIGLSIFVFSCINCFISLKKHILIPTEMYIMQVLIGLGMYRFFLIGPFRINQLIMPIVINGIIVLIIFPLRGISYQIRIPKDHIVDKLRSSIDLKIDEQYTLNSRFHQMITLDGVKILIGSTYRDKFREVYIIGGYRLKRILQVKETVIFILNPIADIEEQRNDHKKTILLGLICLCIYIAAKFLGFVA
jgi:hypothetical protein